MPKFIACDEGLSEDEKRDAAKHFSQSSTTNHHPSMTYYAEQRSGISAFEYEDISEKPLTEAEFLAQFNISHLPSKAQETCKRMFLKHRAAFSKHKYDIGRATDFSMDFQLKSQEPSLQKYSPLPFGVRQQVREILQQMEKCGIIRECTEASYFCSNLLVTRKKDGNIRILLDARLLNEATVRLPTIMVTRQEVLAHLVNRTHVSTIDLSDAFFHIAVKPEAQKYLAFYSESVGKRYCFTAAPQGCKNSPLYLKLLLDKVFAGLADNVLSYADDIILTSKGSLSDHLKLMSEVLRRLAKANLRVRPAKISIATDTVEFLGIVWKRNTISIPHTKLSDFNKLASPSTPKKLKSIVCALSFYRTFVPNFAALAQPLHVKSDLHPKQFKWTNIDEIQLRTLISAVCKHNSVHLPDPEKAYYVQSDASMYAGGATIYQLDSKGNELILACLSHIFNKAERAYSIVKKECLTLLYALKAFDFFLRYAKQVVLRVDAKSLTYLRMAKEGSGILLRFSLELSKYEASIEHVPGEKNVVADVLSRQHKDIAALEEAEIERNPLTEKETLAILKRLTIPSGTRFSKEEVQNLLNGPSPPSINPKKTAAKAKGGIRHIKNTPQKMNTRKVKLPKTTLSRPGGILPKFSQQAKRVMPLHPTIAIQTEEDADPQQNNADPGQNAGRAYNYSDIVAQSQIICDGIVTIKDFKKAQSLDPFCREISEMDISDRPKHFMHSRAGVLLYSRDNKVRPVLPVALLDALINTKHFTILGNHASKARITREIKNQFYILPATLKEHLAEKLDSCFYCQIHGNQQPQHHLQQTDFAKAPRHCWAVDLLPSMPTTRSGNKKALIAVDYYTGYVQCIALPDKQALALVDTIEKHIIAPFGPPRIIRSDEETALYDSTEFHAFCQKYGIQLMATASQAPWSNGLAETCIRSIKKALKTILQQENQLDRWDELLIPVVSAHNSSINVYGYSPEEMMFGYKKATRSDILEFWPNVPSQQEYLDTIEPKVTAMRQEMRRIINRQARNQRTYRNKTRVSKEFKPGDIVLHRQLQVATGTGSSLHPRFTGPYIVERVNNDNSTAILEHQKSNRQIKAHFSNMQRLEFNPTHLRVPSTIGPNLFPSLRLAESSDDLFGGLRVDSGPPQGVSGSNITRHTQFHDADVDSQSSSRKHSGSQQSVGSSASQQPSQAQTSPELDLDDDAQFARVCDQIEQNLEHRSRPRQRASRSGSHGSQSQGSQDSQRPGTSRELFKVPRSKAPPKVPFPLPDVPGKGKSTPGLKPKSTRVMWRDETAAVNDQGQLQARQTPIADIRLFEKDSGIDSPPSRTLRVRSPSPSGDRRLRRRSPSPWQRGYLHTPSGSTAATRETPSGSTAATRGTPSSGTAATKEKTKLIVLKLRKRGSAAQAQTAEQADRAELVLPPEPDPPPEVHGLPGERRSRSGRKQTTPKKLQDYDLSRK